MILHRHTLRLDTVMTIPRNGHYGTSFLLPPTRLVPPFRTQRHTKIPMALTYRMISLGYLSWNSLG